MECVGRLAAVVHLLSGVLLHPNSASRTNKATFIVTWNHYLLKNIACFTHIRFIRQIRRNKLSSKTSPHGLTRHEFAFLPLSLLVWVKHTMQIDKLLRLHTAKVRLFTPALASLGETHYAGRQATSSTHSGSSPFTPALANLGETQALHHKPKSNCRLDFLIGQWMLLILISHD